MLCYAGTQNICSSVAVQVSKVPISGTCLIPPDEKCEFFLISFFAGNKYLKEINRAVTGRSNSKEFLLISFTHSVSLLFVKQILNKSIVID
jgi:hypothetical protein